jgi:hypothetical protein
MGIFIPSYPRANYSYGRRNRDLGIANKYPKKAKSTPTFMFKSEDVWSAAAAATRINGGYLKEPVFTSAQNEDGDLVTIQTKDANKALVRKLLEGVQGWTEEDVAVGAEARAYWQAQLMKLVGGTANDFEQTAINLANKETVENNYDLAVISSLIASAQRGKAREQLNETKSNLDSKHQGTVGDHLVLRNAEVIATGPLADFGKYRVDAKLDGNLYTWWSSKTYAAGSQISVKGKVKGHTKDRATNTAVTQLNYVKEA